MSSEFTFGDNSDKLSIFQFLFMNLVDCDLTEYQITQTLTLSRLHAPTGADKENQTVHTQATCVLEQTRGIRLFNHPLERTGDPFVQPSVQCSAFCANPWSDFMEWIHDQYSVVEKHAQTMLQLLEFGMRGMCWETWRSRVDREYSSSTDCGRDHRGEANP